MKKIAFTLLAMCILCSTWAQTSKCGIDTKALVKEEIASGAATIRFLAKMVPDFDRGPLVKAGITIGAQAGQIVTLTVPVDKLDLLESNAEVLQYSISHRIAAPMCSNTRVDTRTDSLLLGEGTIDGNRYDGTGVYIGITDWGFDYTHPNLLGMNDGSVRISRAWDHFRHAGPAPEGFNFGTEIVGAEALLEARGDTSNLYNYGTHGTHVAGIAAGRGRGSKHIGQAPNANLLLCSFGLGEADWMDGVAWMRNVAQAENRRLVVNSSWGMYSFSTLDGTSLLSQAIDSWTDQGTVFCTSAGNNGDVAFHIEHTFNRLDTLKTVATYYNYVPEAIGQCLIMWGEEQHDFGAFFRMVSHDSVWTSPMYSTADCINNATGDSSVYDTLVCGDIRIPYRVFIEHVNPFDSRPHIQMDVNKDLSLQLQLFIVAESGTVHAWNVANKTNHAGNEGTPFSSGGIPGFENGDKMYGIGEPACAAKCISVAAHSADRWNNSHTYYNKGGLAYFTSYGPLINGAQKPDVSAPGVDVVSSISAWTDGSYAPVTTQQVDGINYKWAAMSGTSMSGPAVTGVVALMLQADPTISTAQVRDILCLTTRNDEYTGPLHARDSASLRWGWGKVDALKAVNQVLRSVSIETAENYRLPLHVYPNPASHTVSINTGCGEMQNMSIYTIDGRCMMRQAVTTETQIDIADWPKGVYVLQVGSRVEKLIVK